eukprot:27581_6
MISTITLPFESFRMLKCDVSIPEALARSCFRSLVKHWRSIDPSFPVLSKRIFKRISNKFISKSGPVPLEHGEADSHHCIGKYDKPSGGKDEVLYRQLGRHKADWERSSCDCVDELFATLF